MEGQSNVPVMADASATLPMTPARLLPDNGDVIDAAVVDANCALAKTITIRKLRLPMALSSGDADKDVVMDVSSLQDLLLKIRQTWCFMPSPQRLTFGLCGYTLTENAFKYQLQTGQRVNLHATYEEAKQYVEICGVRRGTLEWQDGRGDHGLIYNADDAAVFGCPTQWNSVVYVIPEGANVVYDIVIDPFCTRPSPTT